MASNNEVVVGGGDSPLRALSPYVSMVVIMNTFCVSTTSLLEQVFFHNTIFQLGFLMSFEKKLEFFDKEI
jgi:hypothetical protein